MVHCNMLGIFSNTLVEALLTLFKDNREEKEVDEEAEQIMEKSLYIILQTCYSNFNKVNGSTWLLVIDESHVTVPQLKPVIYGVALLDLIWTFQLFPLVWLTTGGGPGRATEVLSTLTFRLAFVDFEFAQAATAAVSILVISAAFTILYLRNEARRI